TSRTHRSTGAAPPPATIPNRPASPKPATRCVRKDPGAMIREVIITTVSAAGTPHIAPFGLIAAEPDEWVIAPFHPSTTLDNLREIPFLVANYTDDVRIFAGCLTGRRNWPCVPSA